MNTKGISLITLIITIIVILILTGAVVLTFVENNPIDQANAAVIAQTKANVIDAVSLMDASNQLNIALGKDYEEITLATIATAVSKTEEELTILGYSFEEGQVKYGDEVIYTLSTSDSDSSTEAGTSSTVTPGVAVIENTTYTDSNSATAVIPKGFMVSTVSTEQTISTGLVIIDEDGNEFVWIPVEDGTLDRTEWGTGYVTTSETTEEIPTEISDSVDTNKGFYIARYEAGNVGDSAVSKKNQTVYNNITWTDSVTKAAAMYPSTATTYGVVSTLCYGAQWDEALEFIESNSVNTGYATDSTEKGNYTGTLLTTGYTPAYMVNNIYDMAGNVWDWTMEEYGSSGCVNRGGHYDSSSSSSPASRRNGDYAGNSGDVVGFRIALYIQ